MPVGGKKYPGGQEERMKSAPAADGQRQTLELCVIEFAPWLERAHCDEKEPIEEKRAMQPRHAARIRHRRRDDQSSRRPQRRRSALRTFWSVAAPENAGTCCRRFHGRFV